MGSLFVTFIVFFIALLLIHLWMFRIGKRPRLWKKIDYIWLSAVVLSIIGATGEVRKFIADNTSSMFEERFQNTLEFARYYVNSTHEYYLRLTSQKWEPNKENNVAEMAFREAEQQLTHTASKLTENPESRPWKELLNRQQILGSTQNHIVMQDEQIIRKNLRMLDEAYEQLLINRQERGRSEWEKFLLVLLPWVLAVALALRITKVTAELKGFA
jgi:hypothetical protein